MHLSSPPWGGLLVLAALAAAGCSADPNRPYPVSGVVVFEDGQPAKGLAGGSVGFTPVDDEKRPSSIGTIAEDGTFTLSCKKQGDGAVLGKHRVAVSEPESDEGTGDDPKAARRPPPKAILDPESATQEVKVEAKSNQFTIKVKRSTGKRPSS